MQYPFSAIVGQQALKTALLLCAVDHRIGGVLIVGPRGTAKSTTARSLAELIGAEKHFINLPLSASEEKLVGTLDLQKALSNNTVQFSEGLFAKAHHGILYVDEINLLPDHLVDIMLDVAASGINHVERDGISHQHEADFILIGTMNPDEGELRPQLLDRFGLMVKLSNEYSLDERQQIMRDRLAFDKQPAAFSQKHAESQQQLKEQLLQTKERLQHVDVPKNIEAHIATICHEAQVEGLRADITLHRAATAHAALQARKSVTLADVDAVKDFVLSHRQNNRISQPPKQPPQAQQAKSSQQPKKHDLSKQGSSIQGSWGEMPPESVTTGEKKEIPAFLPNKVAVKKNP